MLLLGAKGALEGPGADSSLILASILVSSGGLLEALGVLWEVSGSLWAPKWRPGATKDGTEDLQERFCEYLKNLCFYKGKQGFWRSGRHLEASGRQLGGSLRAGVAMGGQRWAWRENVLKPLCFCDESRSVECFA